MAWDDIAGILEAGIALHHRFGEIAHQSEQGHHGSQHRSDQPAPVPAEQLPPQAPNAAGAGHAPQGALHGLARGDGR